MREYKFRGKRKDNGDWAYGSLTVEYDGACHVNYWVSKLIEPENNYWEPVHEMCEVIPESVGQFTGLKDKSGKEIYDGDILKSFSPSVPSYEVFYDRSSYRLRYKLKCGDWYDWGPLFRMEEIQWEDRLPLYPDIIGNIHDNPELLNPAQGQGPLNTMQNLDPKEGQAEEVKNDAAEQATEQTAPAAGQEATQGEATATEG